MQIYNIASSAHFIEHLAQGIINRFDTNQAEISHLTVILPNRISCASLVEALNGINQQESCFLPNIITVDDLEELVVSFFPHNPILKRKVISAEQRLLLLSHLIESIYYKNIHDDVKAHQKSLHLAQELASFFDECYREDISPDKLSHFPMNENLLSKWQISSNFIQTIYKKSQEIYEQRQLIEPEKMRLAVAESYHEYLKKNNHPIIIAGTTASVKATFNIIKNLQDRANSILILNALDERLTDDELQQVSVNHMMEIHPQYLLSCLIKRLNISTQNIQPWSPLTVSPKQEEFIHALSSMSNIHALWQQFRSNTSQLNTIKIAECKNSWEEAHIICQQLYEAKSNGLKCGLISSNHTLIQQLQSLSHRYQINIKNDHGTPLIQGEGTRFFLSSIKAAQTAFNVIDFLAFIKNPLCYPWLDTTQKRSFCARLEGDVLRQNISINSMQDMINTARIKVDIVDDDYLVWLDNLEKDFAQLTHATQTESHWGDFITRHIDILNKISEKEGVYVWQHTPDAPFLLETLAIMTVPQAGLTRIKESEYLNSIIFMLDNKRYIEDSTEHADVIIYSSLEARLLSFDLLIIAEMNVETWHTSNSTVWLNNEMQREFGFKSPNVAIGQSSHDLLTLISSAKTTLLTRARSANSSPTTASPWLERIKSLCKDTTYFQDLSLQISALYNAVTATHVLPCTPPMPKPPVELRPTTYSATAIGKLLKNPYEIYAKKILKLRPQNDLIVPLDAKMFGNIVHKILEEYVQLPQIQKTLQALQSIADKQLEASIANTHLAPVWKPCIDVIIEHFHMINTQIEQSFDTYLTEKEGKINFTIAGREYTILSVADRIDSDKSNGNKVIYDYKTGKPPTAKAIEEFIEPQLWIIALILNKGGFKNSKEMTIEALNYWPINIKREMKTSSKLHGEDIIATGLIEIEEKLVQLLTLYSDVETAYLSSPYGAVEYNDYAHLARESEWQYNITKGSNV